MVNYIKFGKSTYSGTITVTGTRKEFYDEINSFLTTTVGLTKNTELSTDYKLVYNMGGCTTDGVEYQNKLIIYDADTTEGATANSRQSYITYNTDTSVCVSEAYYYSESTSSSTASTTRAIKFMIVKYEKDFYIKLAAFNSYVLDTHTLHGFAEVKNSDGTTQIMQFYNYVSTNYSQYGAFYKADGSGTYYNRIYYGAEMSYLRSFEGQTCKLIPTHESTYEQVVAKNLRMNGIYCKTVPVEIEGRGWMGIGRNFICPLEFDDE